MSPRAAPPRLSAMDIEKLSMSTGALEVQTVSDLGVNGIPLPPMFSPQTARKSSGRPSSQKTHDIPPPPEMLDDNPPLSVEGKVATPVVQELRKSFSSSDPQVQQFLRSPTAKLGLSIVGRGQKSDMMSDEESSSDEAEGEAQENDLKIDKATHVQAPPLLDDDGSDSKTQEKHRQQRRRKMRAHWSPWNRTCSTRSIYRRLVSVWCIPTSQYTISIQES